VLSRATILLSYLSVKFIYARLLYVNSYYFATASSIVAIPEPQPMSNIRGRLKRGSLKALRLYFRKTVLACSNSSSTTMEIKFSIYSKEGIRLSQLDSSWHHFSIEHFKEISILDNLLQQTYTFYSTSRNFFKL
jgi:hypothetical protein